MKLTAEDVNAVYDEIGKMFVKVDADSTRGLQYCKERLTLCRAMQDRLNEVQLRVNRAVSDLWQEQLLRKVEHDLQPSAERKQYIAELELDKQQHQLLLKMITAKSQLLSRTSMDIRLLADLTKDQIKLGEIDPKESPELISQVGPNREDGDHEESTAAPFPYPELNIGDPDPFAAAPAVAVPSPFQGSAARKAPGGETAAEFVSLDDPIPAVPDDGRVRLPETAAVSFDDLFSDEVASDKPF